MGAKVHITDQDVVITKSSHDTWNQVVAEIRNAAIQSVGSSTPRRVFIIAGETEADYRWNVPDAFIPGSPSTVSLQSQDINLEVYGVRNSAGQRPLIMPSPAMMLKDGWEEARRPPFTPRLFEMSNSGSGRLLIQSLETRGCSLLLMGTGIVNQLTPSWTRTRPQTVIVRDVVAMGTGFVVQASYENPRWNYLQQRGTPNDTIIVEDCTFIEGVGTHLFYVDLIRASYFRRNKFAGANNNDMSAFRGVGMHCFVTDNVISDGNLQGTIQDKRDELWWWNQSIVQWASKTFAGSTSQSTYVWPYRIALGNEDMLRVTVSGLGTMVRGTDYDLTDVGELACNVVFTTERTAQLAGRTVTLDIIPTFTYRIPIENPGQATRTSAQPLSVQHGQQLVIEGNTLIKSEGYGGSATFDFVLWQKRWAWTGGHAVPYNPKFKRRIWDHWAWEGGNPSPVRGPEFCDQWNDAYWQSITDAGITMDPLSDPPYQRMRNPHINYLLLGPNTFVRGADPYDRAPPAAYILKAETDYPSHTDASNPRAFYAYGYQGLPPSGPAWPPGPVGMQSRAQAVVWPQEGMTFEGDWAPIWNHPRTWTVGTSTVQSHPGLFNWMPKVNTNIDSNIGFKKSPQANAAEQGEWAYDPKIHLLEGADVPNGYPDWWQSKRDPEAGNPAPDYEHMIVDVRNF